MARSAVVSSPCVLRMRFWNSQPYVLLVLAARQTSSNETKFVQANAILPAGTLVSALLIADLQGMPQPEQLPCIVPLGS